MVDNQKYHIYIYPTLLPTLLRDVRYIVTFMEIRFPGTVYTMPKMYSYTSGTGSVAVIKIMLANWELNKRVESN